MERVIDTTLASNGVRGERDLHPWYLVIGLSAGYVLLDWLTYHFPGRYGITPFNPEAAVAIALLVFCGLRYVPFVFVVAMVGEFFVKEAARPLDVAVITSTILTAGYVAVAATLTRWWRMNIELSTRRDVFQLIAATLFCMLLCGLFYVGILRHYDVAKGGNYFFGVRRFLIGYSVGILVAAPLVLMAFSAKRRVQLAALLRSVEAWLVVAAIAACIAWVFTREEPRHVHSFYLLFLPLIWAATRFGMPGAAVALALTQVAVFMVFYLTEYTPLSVFELQLLLITLVITGLLLGVTIDELRRTSADFRESLKFAAAGEMAAALAHELNQPLTALSSYANAGRLMAAAPDPDHARLVETMDKLQAEARRTAAVVQRLRDFFRSGTTRLQPLTISESVDRVMDRLRTRAQATGVTLVSSSPGPLPPVLADAQQIELVLRNLIANAIEAAAAPSTGRGQVEVMLATNAAREVQVTVHDNGAGIRAADCERLFESFVTTKTTGMGMGLAICRAIIEAHGGRIWAVPGNSGMVCFALPAEKPPAAT